MDACARVCASVCVYVCVRVSEWRKDPERVQRRERKEEGTEVE